MAFDPNLPANNTPLNSAEMRSQLTGLKSLFDLAAMPIGSVVAHLKHFPGVPALSANWAECNGQVLNDPASPFDGQTLPDLNNLGRFLRGALASGGTGGNDSFGTATADNSGTGPSFSVVSPDFSPGASPFPPFYEVVWVMRVK